MSATAKRNDLEAAQVRDWRRTYERDGHATLPSVFSEPEIAYLLAALEDWGAAFLAELGPAERRWYLERPDASAAVLRKLDNPHVANPAFAALAADPRLVEAVEALIGPGISVYFSQIFMKPAGGGGPKPVHQDNFYFGPTDPEGLTTAWIALDEATLENGCLFFGNGTHKGPILDHVAPPERPFDLQIPEAVAAQHVMTPAPVPRGGVSFHHGSVLHQSSDNRSARPRRACAFHYVRNDVVFADPALPYDDSLVRRITD